MNIRRNRIINLARKILNDNDIRKPPVPVEAIAKHYGIEVVLQPLDNDSDVSAILLKDKDSAIIGVNSAHARVRQRFSVAHELGHFLLHEGIPLHIDRTIYAKLRNSRSSEGTDTEEIEANLFAAELLMPRDFIENDLKMINNTIDIDSDFIQEMAICYNVSMQALIHRLTNLDYFDQ